MASIADIALPESVRALAAYADEMRRTRRATRTVVRPDSPDGTPFEVWRARERAYARLVGIERMMSARPGPAHSQSRKWDANRVWYGTRLTAPIPDDAVLTRNVGPNDVRWGARRDW
jgi:hypothetical protein